MKIEFHCCYYPLHIHSGIILRILNYTWRFNVHTRTHSLSLFLSHCLLIEQAHQIQEQLHSIFTFYIFLYSVRVRAVERDKRDSVIIKEEGVEITKHNNYQIGPISSQYFYLGTTRSLLKPPFSQSRCECIFMRTKSFIEIDIDVGA